MHRTPSSNRSLRSLELRRQFRTLTVGALMATTTVGTACTRTDAEGTAERPSVVERVIVDGSSRGRRFDGVGGVSSGGSSRLLLDYPEPARSEILDYMFTPGYGAALQMLKIEIGGDMNGTVGSEASHMREPDEINCNLGYEWWLAKEAKRRNPEIKLVGLQWGAPGWFDGGFWSDDNIHYLTTWLDCARENGLVIDYMGGWNESGTDPDWYVRFSRVLRERYPDVLLVAADNSHTAHWNVVTAMVRDSAFQAAVDVVGVHGPGGSRTNPDYTEVESHAPARELGKPLWASELSSLAHDVGAMPLARVFNRSYIDARITGQMIWTPVSAWYPTLPIADTGPIVAEWPWSGYYDVGKSVWTLAHTTQFTAPGWHYLDTGSQRLESGATIVSFVSPDAADYTLVVEGMDVIEPITLAVTLRNLPAGELRLWATDLDSDDPEQHFRELAPIRPESGEFELRVDPRHVYTISTRTTGGKGNARPTATVHDQLGIPFREDFDSLSAGRLARYFSDVNGGFETAACGGGRAGMCYRQMVARHPIEWHGPDMPPTTIVGDPRWWGDYLVSTDVMLEQSGYVELLGRVDGIGGDEHISGYHLRVGDDGAWMLYSQDVVGANTELLTGQVPFAARQWHTLAMHFEGSQVRVLINGTERGTVRDDRHRVGQIGLQTSRWIRAQFDNVSVTPTVPAPRFISPAEMTATATTAHEGNAYGYTYPASAAIDDRPETYWRSEWQPVAPLPQAITLDLGSVRDVGALTYRPRISGHWAAPYPGSPIREYTISLSNDGQTFTPVTTGSWRGSLAATKVASFGSQHRARFVRLEGTDVGLTCDASITAAAIRIATAPIADPSPDVPVLPDGFGTPIPGSQLSAVGAGASGTSDPAAALDGDCATYWEPVAETTAARSITVDLGGERNVSGLAYLPRQDQAVTDGRVNRYTVSISSDGRSFTPVASGAWPDDATRKFATWAPRTARYVRLEAIAFTGARPTVADLHVGARP